MVFDYLSVRLNGPQAVGKTMTLNFDFTDTKEKWALTLDNAVLNCWPKSDERADASYSLDRTTLNAIILGKASVPENIES